MKIKNLTSEGLDVSEVVISPTASGDGEVVLKIDSGEVVIECEQLFGQLHFASFIFYRCKSGESWKFYKLDAESENLVRNYVINEELLGKYWEKMCDIIGTHESQ